MQSNAFILPNSVVSPTDVARLSREVESVESFFQQQSIRSSGQSIALPRLSKLLDQLASENQLNLLNENDRLKMTAILTKLHNSSPILHISFSVDPPGNYVQKIVDWLRKNIHAYVLVTVGLQPNIGAGCVVRTTNKIFDFSLREFFVQKRGFFVEKLHSAITEDGMKVTADAPIVTALDEDQTNKGVSENSVAPMQAQTGQKIAVSDGSEGAQ